MVPAIIHCCEDPDSGIDSLCSLLEVNLETPPTYKLRACVEGYDHWVLLVAICRYRTLHLTTATITLALRKL
jgi:hypothetical protein